MDKSEGQLCHQPQPNDGPVALFDLDGENEADVSRTLVTRLCGDVVGS